MNSFSGCRLELDVGNTRIKWRLVSAEKVVHQGVDLKSEVAFEVGAPSWLNDVHDVWVSSVHQEQNKWIESQFSSVHYAATKDTQCGLINSYADVSRMGVDRWLAMLAARQRDLSSSHIVIDAGTAITLDVIDAIGQHVGGYICPGLEMMKQALLGGTNSVLADSDWEVGREPGMETQVCVDHGIQDMVLSWFERHFLLSPDAKVTISGGDGERLSGLLGLKDDYYPDLVLDGLNISLKNK